MKECNIISDSKLGILFGFFGVSFLLVMLFLAIFLTPNYSFFKHTISSLGNGNGKFFFSVGFVVAGSFGIPFAIYLDRELVDLGEHIRKFTSGFAIFTNVCIALVGIIPDETYIDMFILFHGFVSSIGFGGISIYILLYSILIYRNSNLIKHKKFKKYLSYYGFSIMPILIILIITITPLVEWVLMFLIIIWVMMITIQCIKN